MGQTKFVCENRYINEEPYMEPNPVYDIKEIALELNPDLRTTNTHHHNVTGLVNNSVIAPWRACKLTAGMEPNPVYGINEIPLEPNPVYI